MKWGISQLGSALAFGYIVFALIIFLIVMPIVPCNFGEWVCGERLLVGIVAYFPTYIFGWIPGVNILYEYFDGTYEVVFVNGFYLYLVGYFIERGVNKRKRRDMPLPLQQIAPTVPQSRWLRVIKPDTVKVVVFVVLLTAIHFALDKWSIANNTCHYYKLCTREEFRFVALNWVRNSIFFPALIIPGPFGRIVSLLLWYILACLGVEVARKKFITMKKA